MELGVSVIIPFCREGKLLEPTIQSVLNQTFRDFEIILVNNNATDESLQIVHAFTQSYPDRIRLVHETDQGACSARNSGIKAANGEYIALLDGDDLMKPDRLRYQFDFLSSRTNVVLLSCHHDLLSHDGSTVLEENRPDFGYGSQNMLEWKSCLHKLFQPFSLPHYESFDLFGATFMFFRKKDAIRAGLFDTVFNPRDLEDFEFCMRMFELGGFYLLPETLQYYRDEVPETRKHKKKDKHTKDRMTRVHIFMSILWKRYVLPYPENIPTYNSLLAFHLVNFGTHLMQFSEGRNIGRLFIQRALRTKPQDFRIWKWYVKTWLPRSLHQQFFEFDMEKTDSLDFDEKFAEQFLRI